MRFRKKPIEIEAVQWTGDNLDEIARFIGYTPSLWGDWIAIKTLECVIFAEPGDFIIRGIKGEYYPCKPDIFEATYEVVE